MSTKVFKEYKNIPIHSQTIVTKDDVDIEYNFCDSTKVDLIQEEKSRIIKFENEKYREGPYGLLIIGEHKYSFGKPKRRPGLSVTPATANNSDMQDIEIKEENKRYPLSKCMSRSSGIGATTIEEATLTYESFDFKNNFEVTFYRIIKSKKTPLNEYTAADFRVTNCYTIDFHLLNYVINDDNTMSGEIKLVFRYYKCPKCNNHLSLEFYNSERDVLQGVYLYDDEEHYKITVMRKHVKVKDSLSWIRYYKNMFIYKKKTSTFYKVENYNYSGSKWMKDRFKKTVKNATFSCMSMFHDYAYEIPVKKAKKEFEQLVLNHMEEKFGDLYTYTKSDCDNLLGIEEANFLYLIQIKNMYNIQNTLLAQFILKMKQCDPKLHSKIKDLNEKEIMSFFKLNTKRLKKIVTGRFYYSYSLIYELVDDINNLNTLIENMSRLYEPSTKLPKYKDFYYHYRKNNTEKRFVNQLCLNDTYYIKDTRSMYEQIKSKIRDYETDFSRSIRDLHDIYSKEMRKIRNPNEKIPKNKDISNMFKDVSINDITYRMAKDTDELVRVGAIMDICVGGYGKRAVAKGCFIVVGYNKDNIPVTCIELSKVGSKYHVQQVKKRKNFLPKPSENNLLLKVFEDNNVVISTCDVELQYTSRRLPENESELLEKRDHFTYAFNVPDELREQLIG